jgi:hypothetical protein
MAEFDPRRAEPGQAFSYHTSVDATLDDGEDVPEGVEILSVDPETKQTRIRRFGVERTLRADDQGVVHPQTAEDEAVLLSFGLPVARKAAAEEKAAADAKAAKKAEG